MLNCCAIGAIMLAVLTMPAGNAYALEESKYPDWSGQWERFIVRGLSGQPSFDQTKPWGFGQQAPLTPEYQKVLEDSMADQANGGLGNYQTPRCLAAGMPLMMIAFRPLEFVVTPATILTQASVEKAHCRTLVPVVGKEIKTSSPNTDFPPNRAAKNRRLTLLCIGCDRELRAPDGKRGTVTCPHCGATNSIGG
jgi:hypothetical protein